MAKRNYTQTHDMDAKHKMDESSRDHLTDTIATVKEMWTDADPNMKMQMKQDLNRLVQEMVI